MPPPPRSPARRNTRLALVCVVVFVGMVGMAFAAVPFYRAFCQATGFAGAVRRASVAPTTISRETVVVNFDTNVRDMTWRFQPDQPRQTVRLGESKLAFFRATNTGDKPVTGRALFNIVPEAAGPYFSKLECFCFKNQTIQPGETVEFPVVYFVDPRYAKDKDAQSAGEITLSYTFFPAVDAGTPAKQVRTSSISPSSPLGGSARAGL